MKKHMLKYLTSVALPQWCPIMREDTVWILLSYGISFIDENFLEDVMHFRLDTATLEVWNAKHTPVMSVMTNGP